MTGITDGSLSRIQECTEGFYLRPSKSRKRFVNRYLDPSDRLEEVLCGLIMVLDFTLIAGFTAGTGAQAVRHLLMAALGCNVAWGVIDGALYIMGSLTARRQRLRFLMGLRNASCEREAFSALSGQLDPLLEPATGAADRARICHALLPLMSEIELPAAAVTKEDVYGSIAIFWIDFSAVFPAIVPFLVFRHEPRFALRVSNALLLALLFGAGLMWGKYNRVAPYLTGLFTMLIGLVLVGVAIALGG
ncbi:MAG: hypothetical protein ACLP3R_25955 [Candidatus Korobacteraceae bacterium]